MDSNIIKLYDFTIASRCDLNLNLFEQLSKNRIMYNNNLITIALIKDRKVITLF